MSRTVIFDFDGTLANSIAVALRVYNQLAPLYRAEPVSLEELPMLQKLGYAKAARAKHVRWRIVPRLLMHASREMKQHMGEVKPYPGVVECIKQLKNEGFVVGVLTSNQEALVRDFFAAHGFPEFDFVVSEKSLFGKDKALKKIMRRRGLSRGDVIYIGDETRDVAACRRIGVPVIGVSWGLAGAEGFAELPPDYLVHTPAELAKAIRS